MLPEKQSNNSIKIVIMTRWRHRRFRVSYLNEYQRVPEFGSMKTRCAISPPRCRPLRQAAPRQRNMQAAPDFFFSGSFSGHDIGAWLQRRRSYPPVVFIVITVGDRPRGRPRHRIIAAGMAPPQDRPFAAQDWRGIGLARFKPPGPTLDARRQSVERSRQAGGVSMTHTVWDMHRLAYRPA